MLRPFRFGKPDGEESPLTRYPNELLSRLLVELGQPRRVHYVWGVMQGARLARVLGMPRISAIEFGVAAGSGLLALERIASHVAQVYEIEIDVCGFDMGTGLPKPTDHRDLPNLFTEGDYPMDVDKLRSRLTRAELFLGPVKETVADFLRSAPAPAAFVAFDLDLYTSTMDAFQLLMGAHEHLLPRVHCYFDDILGLTYGDCNGERLAIADFNTQQSSRKISPIYGLKYFVPKDCFDSPWTEKFYLAHVFDHPSYGTTDHVTTRRLELRDE